VRGEEVPTLSDVDTSAEKRRKKRWPKALKRETVAATRRPGASVSVVARQDVVNANQVFARRRRFRAETEVATPALVPVTITPGAEDKSGPTVSDTIEIEVGDDCRVRVGASFDARAHKRVLDLLRQR
jgi:transposase-like protein